ncbi:hypothetical protein Pla108_05880 [Botrimarina colliarenosi]|uniref:EamA-like transporter family protein n=1 Tax=Botrimarina colliarenosi TaxID=2528001 RepID=A0A5C6AKF5_9BACT|nr:hypothetical protein [Botrimarina colliarenosi]TWT99645.1 hypothetical protein Pla108_05880 [Botrimarina colliarenosi]
MRGLLLVVASIALTVVSWGLYGPVLHRGQAAMSLVDGQFARLRPFVCVGLAYFAIGVIVPAVLLYTKGEKGNWTTRGAVMSLLAGVFGAIGALGIIMAFTYGGKPSVVMPLVFGGAPVVNSFLTIYWAKRLKDIGPIFIAGLLMVVMGAVTVLVCKPAPAKHAPPVAAAVEADETPAVEAPADETLAEAVESNVEKAGAASGNFLLQVLSIASVIACWGAYGPVLHQGQAAMHHSRLRPLLCVGLAYFAIAVVVPQLLLIGSFEEASTYNFSGAFWSLAGGAAGAIGALGIILAFNYGGKPMYVMPLVFGGAPVVTTLEALWVRGGFEGVSSVTLGGFFAGLLLVIVGAAIVLVFAPKGAPPAKPVAEPVVKPQETPPAEAIS